MVAFAYISRRRLEGRFMLDDHPAAGRTRQAGTTVGPVLRRSFRIGIRLGIVGGLVFALVKLAGSRRASTFEPAAAPLPVKDWPPLLPDADATPTAAAPTAPKPDPDAPKAAATVALSTTWVEPTGDVCPTTHPVKAKLTSKIFHLPGMLNYDRTKPDRCYSDGDAAEADGLRPAKR